MIPVKIGKKVYEVSSIQQAVALIFAQADESIAEQYRQHGEGD